MIKELGIKIKESLLSILPITLLVLILGFTPAVNFSTKEMIVFSISAVFLILGIGLFNLGADIAMTPMGEHVGAGLTRSKKLTILLIVCFSMGLLITIAEPDLSVLANQVSAVIKPTLLVLTVGIGVGLFLLIAVLKIVFKKDLSSMLLFFYMMLFAICSILITSGKGHFVPLSFDSGGVTTGPITVPFIMALGVGIANSIGGKHSNENSFGLISLCSIGPMIAVMILSITAKGNLTYTLNDYSIESGLGINIFKILLHTSIDVIKALALIFAFFLILNFTILKLPKRKLIEIILGIIYTFVGLVVFLTAVEIGFMPIGFKLGAELANHKTFAIIFAFIIGAVTVLAEPAVHVLNQQVEDITGGTVTKRSMLIALSIGVGIAICLSIIRIIYNFSLLYYLIPGYLISLGLSFFVPKIYTSIAFDSGGVASGPLTSSFILPFAIGVCSVAFGENEILNLAFGVVSMVAMAPLITIQFLGFRAITRKRIMDKIIMKRILDQDDEEIIYFK